MKIVRTFATSANLGCGFDTLGICFNLYNEYEFAKSLKYEIIGFEKEFTNSDNNLIITSYEEVFKRLNKEIVPIYLKERKKNIPASRGLGSSASCVVTGIMIANSILDNPLSKEEMFQIASSLEGHPDNVAPLIFGGFCASFKDDLYYTLNLKVNKNLKFTLFIPPFKLSTSLARSVIKKEVSLTDAINNISKSIATIKAIENGDVKLLIKANNDKLHEPYRLPLINGSNEVIEFAKMNKASAYISGAGSTMLVISDESLKGEFREPDWTIKEVKVEKKGVYIYEK